MMPISFATSTPAVISAPAGNAIPTTVTVTTPAPKPTATSVPSVTPITMYLYYGLRNDQVKTLQSILISYGDLTSSATGYSALTVKAVQQFQCANSIVCTGGVGWGYVGAKTRAALNAAMSNPGLSTSLPATSTADVSSLQAKSRRSNFSCRRCKNRRPIKKIRNPTMKKILLGIAINLLAVGACVPLAFAATPVVLSAKIVGPNTVDIVFSEPVTTNMASFSNFAGALSGETLVGMNGGGTNTIVLTFSGNNFPAGSSGSLYVSGSTMSVSDGSPFTGGGVSVIDGRAPSLISFGISSTNGLSALGAAGNTLTLTYSMSGSLANTQVIIAGHSFVPSGNGMGPYTLTYTLSTQDASFSSIPVVVAYTDAYGNTGTMNFAFNNSVTASTNTSNGGTLPVISSITSNARTPGYLKVGDTITFTLVPLSQTQNGHVTGAYNGQTLNWTTANNGITYTGTYTVMTGASDQTIPVQIGGVTLTDQYGNTSLPASDSDIAKMISANPPSIYESIPIPSATGNPNPGYTFTSNENGTITFGGDCISPTTDANRGQNTITFINLSAGLHSNCTITVTDSAGNISNVLRVTSFTVLGPGVGNSTPVVTTPAATTQPTQTATSGGNSTAATTTTYSFTIFLGIGSTGTQVTELQNYLLQKGFFTGTATGYYGAQTSAAVKKYQTAHGLTPAGYVGREHGRT